MSTELPGPEEPPAWAFEAVHLSAYVPPELDGRSFRRFLAKVTPDDRHRLAHLHLHSGQAT